MPVERKVYTPRWVAWFITVLMVIVVAFSAYLALTTPPKPGEPPPYVILALVVPVAILTCALVWLSALRKLPAYVIVEE